MTPNRTPPVGAVSDRETNTHSQVGAVSDREINTRPQVGAVSDREKVIHAPVGSVSDRENLYAAQATPKNFWARLTLAWSTLLGRPPHKPTTHNTDRPHNPPAPPQDQPSELLTPTQRSLQPYNPQALPAAREQWQRGDWASLASLTLDELQDHPDRAKLTLLAAAGHMQMGRNDIGADCLRQAKAWGCSPQLMRQIVIAGVHNTLGKAAALADMPERADQHFAASLRTVMPMASGPAQVKQRRSLQMQALETLN